jgi:hypothetical protein
VSIARHTSSGCYQSRRLTRAINAVSSSIVGEPSNARRSRRLIEIQVIALRDVYVAEYAEERSGMYATRADGKEPAPRSRQGEENNHTVISRICRRCCSPRAIANAFPMGACEIEATLFDNIAIAFGLSRESVTVGEGTRRSKPRGGRSRMKFKDLRAILRRNGRDKTNRTRSIFLTLSTVKLSLVRLYRRRNTNNSNSAQTSTARIFG